MRIAIVAVGLLCTSLLLHWLVWRIRLPRRQILALFSILWGVPFLGIPAIVLPPLSNVIGPLKPSECVQIALFQVAMALAYIVAYTALEERSPSMTILTSVADSKGRGRSREELCALLQGVNPVELRLDAMLRDKLASEDDSGCRLTAKGRFWSHVFALWPRLLRMDKGG